MSLQGWLTSIWRTDGAVWVSDAGGRVFKNPSLELRKAEWEETSLNATLTGIWGLRDNLVFTWGIGPKPVAFVFNGRSWRPVDTPGKIMAVRGVSPDLIYGVGLQGLIARWDGSQFRAVRSPEEGALSDVFIVSEDEMYACGTDGGLLTGSVHGWEKVLQHSGMLHCVAKWGEDVWVGAGDDGLFRLTNGRLDLVKPNVLARRFDAREALLITMPGALVETRDGRNFQGSFVSGFENLT